MQEKAFSQQLMAMTPENHTEQAVDCNIAIRRATSSDSDAVFALAREFATSFAVERCAFEASFATLILSSDAFVAAAVIGEKVSGYVLGFDHLTLYANGRAAWVEEIMVSEPLRRRGVGRLLMKAFEGWARDRQSRLIALATRRAAAFYKAIGFEESASYFRKVL